MRRIGDRKIQSPLDHTTALAAAIYGNGVRIASVSHARLFGSPINPLPQPRDSHGFPWPQPRRRVRSPCPPHDRSVVHSMLLEQPGSIDGGRLTEGPAEQVSADKTGSPSTSAEVLMISAKTENPALGAGLLQLKLVAGGAQPSLLAADLFPSSRALPDGNSDPWRSISHMTCH